MVHVLAGGALPILSKLVVDAASRRPLGQRVLVRYSRVLLTVYRQGTPKVASCPRGDVDVIKGIVGGVVGCGLVANNADDIRSMASKIASIAEAGVRTLEIKNMSV